jgi:hypothetical protein
MSTNRAWDRAGSLPVPVSGRRTPEVAALRTELPTVNDLFTFMRDAEQRFETLRMRLEEHSWTARGEEVLIHDVAVRHPGEAKVLTSTTDEGSTDGYEAWVTDGTTVQTYVASRKVGTRRPGRPTVRGVTEDGDLPGRSRVYVPVTLPDGDAARPVPPPRRVLPERARDRRLPRDRTTSVGGREAIVLECDHPRTIELTADRRTSRSGSPWTGSTGDPPPRGVDRRREDARRDRHELRPRRALPPSAFAFTFPPDTTVIY